MPSILPLLYLASLMLAVTVVAEVPLAPPPKLDFEWSKLPRVKASLLTYDTNGAACLPVKRDQLAHQLLDAKFFSGVAVWEGSETKVEVTYSNGIPHGPVGITLFKGRDREVRFFRYDEGRKVVMRRNGPYLTSTTVSGKTLANGGIDFLVNESKSAVPAPETKSSP